ncbi:MAG: RNA polymerase factor sigma-54, partial [Rubrivivax sp.]
MRASLQVRLSQHLALTPQLQQSIRLLQLSTLELHQEVEQMLEQNPFLEPEDDASAVWESPLERAAPPDRSSEREHQAQADAAGEVGAEAPETGSELDAADFGGTEREDWANGTEADDFDGIRELPSASGVGAGAGGDDDLDPQERRALDVSLADHLRGQIPGLRLSAEDAAALMVLIESLNEDGYLADSLGDIAESLSGGLDED